MPTGKGWFRQRSGFTRCWWMRKRWYSTSSRIFPQLCRKHLTRLMRPTLNAVSQNIRPNGVFMSICILIHPTVPTVVLPKDTIARRCFWCVEPKGGSWKGRYGCGTASSKGRCASPIWLYGMPTLLQSVRWGATFSGIILLCSCCTRTAYWADGTILYKLQANLTTS